MVGSSLSRWAMAATAVVLFLPASRAEANFFGLFRTRHRADCCGPAPVVAQYRAAYVMPTAGCSTCQPAPTVTAMAAPAPAPVASGCSTCQTPQPISVPETCMQTRCYQVPVTRYETRTNYVTVTENQVSNYLEPVTTMQTSTYFDPCSCSYQNVATPVTSMVSKQVVTPVQKMIAQNVTVPVTAYVQKCEQVPVTQYRMYMPAGVQSVPMSMSAPVAAPVPPPAPVAAVQQIQQAPNFSAPPAAAQQTIQLPNVPSSPSGSQKPPESGNVQAYPPTFEQYPNRREVIDRVYENGKLVDQRWRMEDPTASSSGESGAPLSPKASVPPPTSGSSYAPPVDQRPLNGGTKQASWRQANNQSNQGYSGQVVLSKPYTF